MVFKEVSVQAEVSVQGEGPHRDTSSVWLLAAAVCLLQIETILIELIGEHTPPTVHTHNHSFNTHTHTHICS